MKVSQETLALPYQLNWTRKLGWAEQIELLCRIGINRGKKRTDIGQKKGNLYHPSGRVRVKMLYIFTPEYQSCVSTVVIIAAWLKSLQGSNSTPVNQTIVLCFNTRSCEQKWRHFWHWISAFTKRKEHLVSCVQLLVVTKYHHDSDSILGCFWAKLL